MKITQAQLEQAAEAAESCIESWHGYECMILRTFEIFGIDVEVIDE